MPEVAFDDVQQYISGTWIATGYFQVNYAYYARFEKYPTVATRPRVR